MATANNVLSWIAANKDSLAVIGATIGAICVAAWTLFKWSQERKTGATNSLTSSSAAGPNRPDMPPAAQPTGAASPETRALAHAEVRLALRQITWPFFALFDDDTEESDLQLVPEHIDDTNRLASVMRIEVRSKTPALSGATFDVPWAEVLKQNADRGAARVDRAMQIYSAYLEPQVLESLFELRTSEFLTRLQGLDEHVRVNTQVKFLDFPFVNAPDMSDCFGFGEFWATIRKLDKLLERDPNRLRRRL